MCRAPPPCRAICRHDADRPAPVPRPQIERQRGMRGVSVRINGDHRWIDSDERIERQNGAQPATRTVPPTPVVLRQRCRRPARLELQLATGDVASPSTRSPDENPRAGFISTIFSLARARQPWVQGWSPTDGTPEDPISKWMICLEIWSVDLDDIDATSIGVGQREAGVGGRAWN